MYGAGSTTTILKFVQELMTELKAHREANARFLAWADAQAPAPAPPPPISTEPPVGIIQHTVRPREPIQLPDPSNLNLLRDFTGTENASFTCPEQALALELVLHGDSNIFLIGPTGMGKSCVFLIPAMLKPYMVTIVLIPLSGLRVDFAVRCQANNIECTEWRSQGHEKSTIVMVSPENVAHSDFLPWAKNLVNSGLLNLFVYDEVHLVKTHAGFRQCFENSDKIVRIGGWISTPSSVTKLTMTV